MRTSLISFAALAIVGAAVSASAQYAANGYDGPRTIAWGGDDERGRDHHDNGWHGNKDRGDDRRDERHDDRRDDRRDDARDWRRGQAYGYTRPDPRYNGYYADNYYRGGAYQPRRLGANDRIYRGQDNRYYCRRSDGTTGLIIGALGGGALGNVIAPGGSKTLGSILGGGLGAVLGSSIDRGNIVCR